MGGKISCEFSKTRYKYIFLNMSEIQRYLLKISNSTYQVVMSDKEEHHSDSDSDMAECLNGLSNESSDPNRNNEHVEKCLKSRRILQDDELLRISKNVCQDWRQLGNALKFNFTKLDALEAETTSTEDAVHKMFQDWCAWKQEKATVGRLSKALFLNHEWQAIESLTP